MRILVVVLVLNVLATVSYCAKVTYDHKALVIDGKRRVLVFVSIHYPRALMRYGQTLFRNRKTEAWK
ncbi:hypothetical protein FF1_019096 [Malus domestica]|uniref:Uncharacterized protein n=1 Tax=Malus domestica TaxID=3750 RepID=A0A498HVL5_MALDO|nr:hypothetical protein DVH24_021222 [Malus domestica]